MVESDGLLEELGNERLDGIVGKGNEAIPSVSFEKGGDKNENIIT